MTWAVLQGVRGSRAVEGLLFPKGRIGLDATRVRAVERKRLSMGNWSRCGPRVPWSFLCAPGLSAPRVFSCGELCLRKSSALSARKRRSAPARRRQGRRLRRRRLLWYAFTLGGQELPGKVLFGGKAFLRTRKETGIPPTLWPKTEASLHAGDVVFPQAGRGRPWLCGAAPPVSSGAAGKARKRWERARRFRPLPRRGVNRARPRRCFLPRPPPSLGRP